jgi:hypothetical protein
MKDFDFEPKANGQEPTASSMILFLIWPIANC